MGKHITLLSDEALALRRDTISQKLAHLSQQQALYDAANEPFALRHSLNTTAGELRAIDAELARRAAARRSAASDKAGAEGIAQYRNGAYRAAAAAFENALSLAETDLERIQWRRHLGNTWRALDDSQQARAHYEVALALAQALGEPRIAAVLWGKLGDLAMGQNALADAKSAFAAALALAEQSGDTVAAGIWHLQLGSVALETKELAEAERELQIALRHVRATGDRQLEAQTLGNLGQVAIEQGAYQQARQSLQAARSIALDIGDSELHASIEKVLAGLNAAR